MNEATRYQQHLAELMREQFCKHPQTAAVAIAKHYAAHAVLAMNILDMSRHEHSSEMQRAIDHCVEQIRRDHIADFGLPLEWAAKGT